MAGQSARNYYFNLDNAAGAPQDLSAEIQSVDANDDIGLEDSTTFGASRTAKSNTVTLTEGGFTIRGFFSTALNNHLKAVKRGLTAGGSLTFILGPTGSTPGMQRKTGECYMKSKKDTGEVNGLLVTEAEFVYDGTITEDTF
jgi:hypothetical protein